MLKIGLIGYGKMGRAIEAMAPQFPIDIVWKISRETESHLSEPGFLQRADIVIEFTQPESAAGHVRRCMAAGIPVVSGTTGWLEEMADVQTLCRSQGGAFLWASNFSVGVNLFFALNQYLSRLMAQQEPYRAALTETHHTQKKDAPSGTAITLAQGILDIAARYRHWVLQNPEHPLPIDALPITALREADIPGTHTVVWQGPHDQISIEHKAFDRSGFAAGAIGAALWLHGKTGVFSMKDVLDLP